MNQRSIRSWCVLFALGLVVAACGDDDSADDEPASDEVTAEEGPVANACPAEGCVITIVDVSPEGEELAITWDANFLPDISGNHIHVYWDTYTADQVSDDAEARGTEQGDWDPTDAYPTYLTAVAASTDNRGASTTLCVTAGDRNHNVLDSTLVDCWDVADLLES